MTADSLHYLIDFDFADVRPQKKIWSATGSFHSNVNISSTYTFHFSGAAPDTFSIETPVQTPKNSSVLRFTR